MPQLCGTAVVRRAGQQTGWAWVEGRVETSSRVPCLGARQDLAGGACHWGRGGGAVVAEEVGLLVGHADTRNGRGTWHTGRGMAVDFLVGRVDGPGQGQACPLLQNRCAYVPLVVCTSVICKQDVVFQLRTRVWPRDRNSRHRVGRIGNKVLLGLR